MKNKEKDNEIQNHSKENEMNVSDNEIFNTSDSSESYDTTQIETGQEPDKCPDLAEQVKEWQDKYLRLSAEFDNFRKRTLREKMDLIKNGGEETLTKLIPVIDDMERAIQAMNQSDDIQALREGQMLIYKKFSDFITGQGIIAIDAVNQEFDTDKHEALTKIPAPTEELKGRVIDVIQKGYFLNDKVIRFAKVVIGE
jgi:molecular chaperone GrpE